MISLLVTEKEAACQEEAACTDNAGILGGATWEAAPWEAETLAVPTR